MFIATLIIATLLCSLVAGFLFAFKIVVMPGIHKLNDRDFIHAFQEMDDITLHDLKLVSHSILHLNFH